MFRHLVAITVALLLPVVTTAGPIRDAINRAGQEPPAVTTTQRHGSMWPGLLVASGGAALIGFGIAEMGNGRSDGASNSDMVEGQSRAGDSAEGRERDSRASAGCLIGGVAAALLGGLLVLRARRARATAILVAPGRVGVQHSVGF
ncbi:MAG TPA: hypothetical protein PLH72_12110 [Vicinamibacterales bacterium]|nr:hypothetical protein [Vicinamibacterales bacterium]